MKTKRLPAVTAIRRGRYGELIPNGGFSRWKPGRLEATTRIKGSAWISHDQLLVVSSFDEKVELPGSGGLTGPTWGVSASWPEGRDRRPTDDDMQRAIYHFGLPAWDEDNHYPGLARMLFCPIDPTWRNACECKLLERVVVEPDGYAWTTNDTEGCRGCDYQKMTGLPCTIHQGG